MKTDEELRQIALDLQTGRIYSDRHIPQTEGPKALSMVFMPLLFLDKAQIEAMKKKDVQFIYEYLDKACPRSVNGMPTFMSFQTLTGDETRRMFGLYEKIQSAIGAVK